MQISQEKITQQNLESSNKQMSTTYTFSKSLNKLKNKKKTLETVLRFISLFRIMYNVEPKWHALCYKFVSA